MQWLAWADVVLAATAAILATETKSLLIGEPAHPEVVESITKLALAEKNLARIRQPESRVAALQAKARTSPTKK
jgi:hypothetical protein